MSGIESLAPLWGVWQVDRLLGSGEASQVYQVSREQLGQRYYSAVKYLHIPAQPEGRQQADPLELARAGEEEARAVVKEIELMYKLHGHSNIVSFEDSLILPEAEGCGYAVLIRMELLTNLEDWLLSATLGQAEIIRLGADICGALAVLSREGLVHGNIKPSNIFVNQHRDYKLGDFGIRRGTAADANDYLAPELCRGETPQPTADIYALGMVLYILCNQGRAPFLSAEKKIHTVADVEQARRSRISGSQLPPPCGADQALAAVILRACAFQPQARYQSAAELKTALLAAGGGSAPQPSPQPQPTGEITLPTLGEPYTFTLEPGQTSLELSNLDITDISPLAGLSQLTWLSIWGNKIQDLSPLATMSQLSEIYMRENQISDLRPLAGLRQLTKLNAAFNKIEDVSPLSGLTRLTKLWLQNNKVKDVGPLRGLKEMTDLNLRRNPVSSDSLDALRAALPDCDIEL